MQNALIIAAATFFAAILITWFMFIPQHTSIPVTHTPQGVSPQYMTANSRQSGTRPIHILFIGNSYTFFYDMPGMIIKIADSDPKNKTPLVIQVISGGGLRLMDHWEKGEARIILRKKPWDYVVLQDNSTWAMYRDLNLETRRYLPRFVHEARKAGVKPIFVKTWVRQPGSAWYTDPKYKSALVSPEHMYDTFNRETRFIAKKLNLDVMPLSDYWMFAQQKHPTLSLYTQDSTHPYVTGSYLNALLFYRYFTGNSPQNVAYAPTDLPKEQARILRKIASHGTL